jgi:DNA (cytosine-5)-methyltransferase 1
LIKVDDDNHPLALASNAQPLNFISMFSGIEAASVAFKPLNWRAVCFAEIDKAASALLAYRYPDTPNVGDMSKHDWSQYRGKIDVVCGGPPCQAFSVAGLRDGLADSRGNLSLIYMKALHAINPRNAIIENVPGWLTMADNAFGCFLGGLVGADGAFVPVERKPADGKSTRWWRWSEKDKAHAVCWPRSGMVSGPKGRAAWTVKDAQYFGLAQRRERVLVVADFGNGADPAAVLFERIGMQGNIAPSREAEEGNTHGQDPVVAMIPAAAVVGCLSANMGGGNQFSMSGQFVGYAPEIARCVATREGSSQDFESTTMVAVGVVGDIAHTLSAEGADASEDGTRGTPIIAFCQAVHTTLRAGGHTTSHANAGVMPAIAFPVDLQNVALGKDITGTLDTTSPGRGGGRAVLTSAVRRLTPKECERLQGFPDSYTRIPVKWYPERKLTKNRPEDMWEPDAATGWWLMAADGPRYKQLGNSWAVPKFRWLGERIQRLMPSATQVATNDNNQERAIAAA